MGQRVREADASFSATAAAEGPPHSYEALSGPLAAGVAVHVGRVIAGLPDDANAHAEGEMHVRVDTGLVVEVLAGSGRHGTLTIVRVR